MKIEVNSEEKEAMIEGVIQEIYFADYGSPNDIQIRDDSDCGESVARWLVNLSFIKKGKKVTIKVMVWDDVHVQK